MRPQIVKKITITALCLFTCAFLGQAQSASSVPPSPSNQRGPGQLPIDDSIFILLVAGLLYGCYIAYKKYQIKNTHS
jgi:hypothetical protein